MNRQFKDTQYYLRRAAATAKHGITEELSPVRERVSRLRDEDEVEQSRLVRVRERVAAGVKRARAEVERGVSRGRERVRSVR